MLRRVAEEEVVLARGAALAPAALVLEQDGEALRPLRVVAGRVQARERGMGQDVDRTISASSSRPFPGPRERPSR
jgi:hypothetical protein